MTDREKVINGLRCLSGGKEMVENKCAGCSYSECQTYAICVAQVTRDALELLKEQEPRLLGLEEVKAIALREVERILSSEVEPVWLEQNDGELTNLKLVLISWWYMEGIDMDETKFEFIAKYFGTDLDDTLNYLDYGTRWRVWSSKPTIEQRKAVKWDD